jgi:transcription termination/antitermination protein NusG
VAITGETSFERGDKVRIIEGPYRGFEALVDETLPQDGRMHVFVRVGGRLTRLELAYTQVRHL